VELPGFDLSTASPGKEMLYVKRLDAGVDVVIFIARPRLPINPSQCAATLQASIPTI